MDDSGGQVCVMLIGTGAGPTVEHPAIRSAPHALSSPGSAPRRFSLLKIFAQLRILNLALILILADGYNQLVLELHRPVAVLYGPSPRPDKISTVNPLCEPMVRAGAYPGKGYGDDHGRVEKELDKVEHWMSAYFAQALSQHATVKDRGAEYDGGYAQSDEDFVRAEGEELMGGLHSSLCLGDGFVHRLE